MAPRNGAGGRASRNCGNCRAVKRRCDQQLPHCGQCVRLHEQCPGYRDEWELVFRDQTNHTVRRSREKRGKKTPTRTPSPKASEVAIPARTLHPSVDEIGVNYFLCNFVTGRQSPSRGCLNYIPSIYSADGEHPTLMTSMAAVGLVALANSTRHQEMASHACAKYAEAIRQVNSALASPVESVKDSTLMSVISLGVFERVSGHHSWMRHVEGAAAVVVARGKSQFSSPASIRMFAQVRADLVLACMRQMKPYPTGMLELAEEASKHTDTSCPAWMLGMLSTRCINLLMKIELKDYNKEIPWAEYLAEATLLDRDFQFNLGGLAVQEPYTTTWQQDLDPNVVYKGRVDLYGDSWAIRVWNNWRSLRMVVLEIICYVLNKFLAMDLAPTAREDVKMKLGSTLKVLSTLCDDVMASLPQGLEYVPFASKPTPSVDLSFNGSVSGGYMLIFALFMVGKCPVSTSETRQWVIRNLEGMGTNSGISITQGLVEQIVKVDQAGG